MASNQDVLEQVFAHLTTGQLLRTAALVCKDWKVAAYQSRSIRVTMCGNSKMARGRQSFYHSQSFNGAEYALDDQLARFKRWLASPSGKHSVEQLDLSYTNPDVFWGVSTSRWQSQPHWLLLELLPRGLSQLQYLRLTNILLHKYSWMDLAHGCKQLTRLELEQPEDCPGSIADLKPLSALVHLSLKHFDGERKNWQGTFDSMGQLTHLSLESCTYDRFCSSSDRGGEDRETVRGTVVAGLSQLKQLHLDLEPYGNHRESLFDSGIIIDLGPVASNGVTFTQLFPHHSTALHPLEGHSEWQQLQHELDLEYCSNLLRSKPPQPAEGVQLSKHSQRWISSRAAKQRSNQSRQGGAAKCQKLRCFKQKL